MIIISGYAQCTLENHQIFKKGSKHSLGIFTLDINFEKNFKGIEKFIEGLGWKSIVVTNIETLQCDDNLNNNILKQGFKRANKNGQSLIVSNEKLYLH